MSAKAAPTPRSSPSLCLFSPAGALRASTPLRRAARRLAALGFAVSVDEAATARVQRFAGDDDGSAADGQIHRLAIMPVPQ